MQDHPAIDSPPPPHPRSTVPHAELPSSRAPTPSCRTAVVLGFVAYALVVALPLASVEQTVGEPRHAFAAAAQLVAAMVLFAIAGLRRMRTLSGAEWKAIVLLAAFARAAEALSEPLARTLLHLQPIHAAQLFLLQIAGPLWLAALAAAQQISEPVPRRVAGCALAVVAAVCLVEPADQLSVQITLLPALVLAVLFIIALFWSWSHARRSLQGDTAVVAAAASLLLSAAADAGVSAWTERRAWQPVTRADLYGLLSVLLLIAAQAGVAALLWFWLLNRMRLAVFAMQSAGVWVAGALFARIALGPLGLQADLAALLGLGAVVVAFRTDDAEDEPVRLRLG
jgi:hypothetical protein